MMMYSCQSMTLIISKRSCGLLQSQAIDFADFHLRHVSCSILALKASASTVFRFLHCRVRLCCLVIRAGSEVAVKFSDKNPKSQLMDQLFASILKTRTDRIAHLRRAVESVTYHVSAEQIAERMLREALGDRLL